MQKKKLNLNHYTILQNKENIKPINLFLSTDYSNINKFLWAQNNIGRFFCWYIHIYYIYHITNGTIKLSCAIFHLGIIFWL